MLILAAVLPQRERADDPRRARSDEASGDLAAKAHRPGHWRQECGPRLQSDVRRQIRPHLARVGSVREQRRVFVTPAVSVPQALSIAARRVSSSVAPVTVRHDSAPSKTMQTSHSQALTWKLDQTTKPAIGTRNASVATSERYLPGRVVAISPVTPAKADQSFLILVDCGLRRNEDGHYGVQGPSGESDSNAAASGGTS